MDATNDFVRSASLIGRDYYSRYCLRISLIDIEKTYSEVKNLETNVKLTYIHSYDNVTPTVGFQFGTSGAAASLSFATTGKAWQIEVDVPDVTY